MKNMCMQGIQYFSIVHSLHRMLTNEKLFLRAMGIVQNITGAGADVARSCILRAIYESASSGLESEPAGWESPDVPMEKHVAVAAVTPLVIPVALLLALDVVLRGLSARPGPGSVPVPTAGPLTALRARELLALEPRVSRAMARHKETLT